MPFVSIIIPTFNSENFIEEAINSVFEQTYSDYEIICVDNNSKDNTIQKLEQINAKHNNKINIIKETKQGSNYARNTGLLKAKGEWIQFLDSDDILYPNKLKDQVALIHSTDHDLVVGNYYYDIDGKRISYKVDSDHWTCLIKAELGCTPSNLWRKDTMQKLGGWDNIKSSQENFLLFKFLKAGSKISSDNNFNCLVRKINSNSISSSNVGNNLKISIDLRIQIYEYLKNNTLLTAENEAAMNSFILDLILAYYYYEKEESTYYYNTFYKPNFKPIKAKLNSGYYFLLKTTGFNNAMKMHKLFNKA